MKMSIPKKEFNSKQQQKRNGDNEKPPAIIVETIKNVKYEYCYLKTVHSMEELDDFRFQHGCHIGNAKRKFIKTTLNCLNRRKTKGMCPYSLMVRRPNPEGNDINVYAYSEHNHSIKPEIERATHRLPSRELVSDANPPANFTTPDGRQWTFLGTAKNLEKMEKFRRKHHCSSRKSEYQYNERTRISMQCHSTIKCKFRLLALKTERHRYHMYTSDKHTCCHANDKNTADHKKAIKARSDQNKLGETQAEEEEQMDVEESGGMEEQGRKGIMEIAGPAGNNREEIAEQNAWPIERIQRRLVRALRKEKVGKVNKWITRTGQEEIGEVLAGLDIEEVVKLLDMAKKAIRGTDTEKFVSIWLCWIKTALSSRGLELAEVPDIMGGLLSRILRRIERRELLPRRKLKTFRKRLETLREHTQQNAANADSYS